ncbi:MAG: isochorismatase family protein [Alphaproteobacteria bacterium]|nr:isochorismatase family protein [Alphaproteobacteria bacterium]
MADAYQKATYDARKVGFGRRPAVVVVDFQKAFTDPQYPIGGFTHIHAAVEETAKLLDVARRSNVPVASCYTGYQSVADMPYWKIDAIYEHFYLDHPSMRLDERIHDKTYDYVFLKKAPSIFFQTPLTSFLTKHGVDTVIVTGCTTSGCVRASIVDSFSNGYRTIVPESCSGDAEEGPHRDNLRDVSRRYADVVTRAEVEAYFDEARRRNA